MADPRNFKFHLFNCDGIYDLNVVEDLLKATKAKLGFEFSVEKHNFTLSEMSELSTKTIPEMRMDFAMFVVHAHESGLFINHDNLEYGYTKVYRALLQATEGNVIIVIGGDDNYKDQEEEDRDFISRWAKRKICSQFREEFIDGRKGFIFSWNKRHRAIHEAALLHHFDPSRKGQKFHYQPPERKRPSKIVTAPPVKGTEPVHLSTLIRSVTLTEKQSRQLEDKWELSPTPKRPLNRDQAVTGQRKEEKLPCSKGDLVILGCNVLQSSMQDVRKLFQDIAPKLNLSESPPFENLLSPVKVKEYLMDNHFRHCVLVVDAEEIKHVFGRLSSKSVEYQQLLETAADKVDKKVVILICSSYSLTQEDERNVDANIKRLINKREKIFPVLLKNGKLDVEADVWVQFMKATSAVAQRNPQTTRPNDDQLTPSACPTYPGQPQGFVTRNPTEWWRMNLEMNRNVVTQQLQGSVTLPPAAATSFSGYPKPNGETVMLKSKLHYGKISYQLKDTEVLIQGFKVPDYIAQGLKRNYHYVSEAVVEIVEDSNGKLRCTVAGDNTEWYLDEEVRVAENEILMFQSRVYYGRVSQRKEDLKCIYPNWEILEYIANSIKREYNDTPYGDVYIISNEKGELRYHVNIGKKDKVLGTASKAWRTLTHFKS